MRLSTTVYLTLKPTFRRWGDPPAVDSFTVAAMTKTRPKNPAGPVVELKLTLPSAAFEPLRPVVEIEVPEDALDYAATVDVVVPAPDIALGEVHAWAATDPEYVSCCVCGCEVAVGVDAHDAGVAADGVELFACPVCCQGCS